MHVQSRERQLEYSRIEIRALDERKRRRKAEKIISVLRHFLGRERLDGLRVVDLGCSAGFICDALADTGASVFGLDIDVPGLARARERFKDRVRFVRADGSCLPFAEESIDVVVLNHIYEHVVDADRVLGEIRRVLRPDGVAYLGLGNRLWVMEPHYRLPMLSYLPAGLADGYVRMTGRGQRYHERYRTRRGLRRMVGGLHIWDYTLPVLAQPEIFHTDELPPGVERIPPLLLRTTVQLLPTYIWIATRSASGPGGPRLPVGPVFVPPLLTMDRPVWSAGGAERADRAFIYRGEAPAPCRGSRCIEGSRE